MATLTNESLLLYIALACFVIGLIVVAIDFLTDGNLSIQGKDIFIYLIAAAVIIIIVAVILKKFA